VPRPPDDDPTEFDLDHLVEPPTLSWPLRRRQWFKLQRVHGDVTERVVDGWAEVLATLRDVPPDRYLVRSVATGRVVAIATVGLESTVWLILVRDS